MSNTHTPRTDAAEKESIAAYEEAREVAWPPFPCDGYDFARQLERELAEIQADRDRLVIITGSLLLHCKKESGECSDCAKICCQYGDPDHFHHDGCPSCNMAESIEESTP